MNKYTLLKRKIETYLSEGLFDKAEKAIQEYKEKNPCDMELLNYCILHKLYTENYEEAEKLLIFGIKKYPTTGDMYFNYAYYNEINGYLFKAYENYIKALFLYSLYEKEKIEDTKIKEIIKNIYNQILLFKENSKDIEEEYEKLIQREESVFGLSEMIYKSETDVVGKLRWLSENDKRYIAINTNYDFHIAAEQLNLRYIQGELLKVKCGNEFCYKCEEKALLPIASIKENNVHHFKCDRGEFDVVQRGKSRFNYYKLEGKTSIFSLEESYYGEPIKLIHNKNNKKLVLNIFIDGLSQTILNDEFEKIMPNTYNFFSNGIICSNAYSTGEWTYPSLASYVSGLETVQHMMINPEVDGNMPDDIKLLAEYFHEKGYYTAKIDGEWRSTPQYGHIRGYDRYDRYVYQNQVGAAKASSIVSDLIEHMEMFKDTDMFNWVYFGQLHDIADGFELPKVVQSSLSLEEESSNIIDSGVTSVKQAYSHKKIAQYKCMIKYIDQYLKIIYEYILDNYNPGDVLVSLFSDHGQGYLVEKGEHFISKNRTNVAFMFYDGIHKFKSDELISICDYTPIMCSLTGIKYTKSYSNGNLPCSFGGDDSREYVISESIHINDSYCITFYAQNYTVYFETIDKVNFEGRVKLDEYNLEIRNVNNNVIEDELIKNRFLKIVFERMAPLRIY